jgi:hypothetical protein
MGRDNKQMPHAFVQFTVSDCKMNFEDSGADLYRMMKTQTMPSQMVSAKESVVGNAVQNLLELIVSADLSLYPST